MHIFFLVDEPFSPFMFAWDLSILRRCQGEYRIGAVMPTEYIGVEMKKGECTLSKNQREEI